MTKPTSAQIEAQYIIDQWEEQSPPDTRILINGIVAVLEKRDIKIARLQNNLSIVYGLLNEWEERWDILKSTPDKIPTEER